MKQTYHSTFGGGRRVWFLTGIAAICLLAMFAPDVVAQQASDAKEISELKKKVAEQDAVIRELLEWKKKVEASLGAAPQVPQASTNRDDRLAELEDKAAQLEEKFSLLPTLSGFYDFEYIATSLPGSHNNFDQHHLWVHLTKDYNNFRLFAEVELEHGARFESSNGTLTGARGKLAVEQAWGEYLYSDLFTLRGGLFRLPNYWNVNHYPNVVLSTRQPLIVDKVFSEDRVGLMAYGTKYWDESGISYSAYFGNRAGQSTPTQDIDSKVLGARLTYHAPARKFFDRFDVSLVGEASSFGSDGDRHTWGAEAQIQKGPVELLTEFAERIGSRRGLYAQPSYRFNEKWAAFYRFDLFNITGADHAIEHTVGVNFRPILPVSLKLELFRSDHTTTPDYYGVATSAAIAF